MATEIISVEQVSKLYRLGEINTGTLSHDLNRWWLRLNGKQDPYERLGELNDRSVKSQSGYVWSLNDISFSVGQGEVFGIIGKNGAGKSTLLKILSKITKPTRGSIKINGRIASLLEIGTGFHPDLSGRENVFLNGAILGMRKKEIVARFDEIIDFSGIERYIDTPVKRYSSGMFVRLAFAVAAHLEPEILIIDEVLAVGDADFQQKCLGKMKDVSQNQGRTVLFVSHNMTAVKQLCNRAMLLKNGENSMIGPVFNVLEKYHELETDVDKGVRKSFPNNGLGYFLSWNIIEQKSSDQHSCHSGENITIQFCFKPLVELTDCEFHVVIRNHDGLALVHANSSDYTGTKFLLSTENTSLGLCCTLPLRQGNYDIEAGLFSEGKLIDEWKPSTKLKILNDADGKFNDTYAGQLNIKTKFLRN
jgi:lipopolysaccharide transport system ATP-binding protein